ncbi:MAG: hypothetical protein KBA66_21165 [Leptospiraceae bacterium]|nr:hypothetical protein [Leptospiraceae bacterium]
MNLRKSSAFTTVTKLARGDKQVYVPSVQSQDLLVVGRLGDIGKMMRKMLGAFSHHFSYVGYA